MPDTLTITREWFAMLEALPTVQSRWNVLCAVARFAFDGEKPDGLTDAEKGMFAIIKPKLLRARQNARYYSSHSKATTESATESATESDSYSVEDDLFSATSNQHSNTSISPSCIDKSIQCSPTGKNSTARRVFKVPSLEEVRDYISSKGYSVDPEEFFSFYESQGWHVGKNPMKDWHRAISYWQCRINNRFKTRTELRDYSGI